jgi:hypothetical protein
MPDRLPARGRSRQLRRRPCPGASAVTEEPTTTTLVQPPPDGLFRQRRQQRQRRNRNTVHKHNHIMTTEVRSSLHPNRSNWNILLKSKSFCSLDLVGTVYGWIKTFHGFEIYIYAHTTFLTCIMKKRHGRETK